MISASEFRHFYPRLQSVGLELQYTGDNLLAKYEGLSGQQNGQDFYAAVAGVEYTLYGIAGKVWDLGLIAEHQYDERPQAAAERFNVGGLRLALNDTWDTAVLVLHSRSDDDQQFSAIEIDRRLSETTSLAVAGQWFGSDNPAGPFGILDDDDEVRVRFSWFF